MTGLAELTRDEHGETITMPSQRFVALENAIQDLRSMASIGEDLLDNALDHRRCRRDENGMQVYHFSDEWIRDLLFAAYDIRRRAEALADDADRISSEAFDAK